MDRDAFGQRQVGALLLVFYGASVVLGLPYVFMLGMTIRWVPLTIALVLAGVGSAIAWRTAREDVPRRAFLRVVPLAFGAIAVGVLAGGAREMSYIHGTLFVVAFAWIGAGQKLWTALKFGPLALVAYLVPAFGRDGRDVTLIIASSYFSVGMGVLVGEAMSWVTSRLRAAEEVNAGRLESMEALLDTSTVLALQLEDSGVADLVAGMGGSVLDGESAVVFVTDPAGGFVGIGSWSWPTDAMPARYLRLAPGESQLMERGLAVGESVRLAGEDIPRCLRPASCREVLATPLRGAVEPFGFIVVLFAEQREVDSFLLQLARAFALQAGLSIERAWARQSLLDAAVRDELTGLGNRRHATALLGNLQPGDAVAMLDLDHFKTVNDLQGHQAGDETLAALGGFLRETLRDHDSAARYGGEEFLLVFRGAGEHGDLAAERLRQGWRRVCEGPSFSIGVAVHEGSATPAETLARADAALYRAKTGGRDRVCFHEDAGDVSITP